MFIFQGKLSLRQIETPYFSQCIRCELTFQNKVGCIAIIFRSPSQSVTEFDGFLVNFGKLLNRVKPLK